MFPFCFEFVRKKCTGSKHKHILPFENLKKRKGKHTATQSKKAKKKLPSSSLQWKHPLKYMLEGKQSVSNKGREKPL